MQCSSVSSVIIMNFIIYYKHFLIGEGKLFDEYLNIINAVLWISNLWKTNIFNYRKRGSV